MANSKVIGIVTRYVDYRESDRILTLFTPDRGRVDVSARGCRKPKSPLLPAAQLFVYGEFELYTIGDKASVRQVSIMESFYPLRTDAERFAAASSALQLAHEAVQEEEKNEELFYLLYYTLSFLSYGNAAPKDLFLCYLAKYLDVIGYRPVLTTCCQCGRDIRSDREIFYSVRNGGAVCEKCATGGRVVSKTALEAIRRMILLDVRDMDRVKMSGNVSGELFPILAGQVEHSFEYGTKSLSYYRDFVDQISLVEQKANASASGETGAVTE